jgi:hypothetical protein
LDFLGEQGHTNSATSPLRTALAKAASDHGCWHFLPPPAAGFFPCQPIRAFFAPGVANVFGAITGSGFASCWTRPGTEKQFVPLLLLHVPLPLACVRGLRPHHQQQPTGVQRLAGAIVRLSLMNGLGRWIEGWGMGGGNGLTAILVLVPVSPPPGSGGGLHSSPGKLGAIGGGSSSGGGRRTSLTFLVATVAIGAKHID